MKMNFKLLLVTIMLMQTGCLSLAKRPKGLPEDAFLAGGIKGGIWLKCNKDNELMHCDVYNYAGRFYETGTFAPVKSVPKCYPSFIISDYRLDALALVPIKIKRFNGGGYIYNRNQSDEISNTIRNAYSDTQNAQISELKIHYYDDCKNGHYIAKFADEKEIIAHIWGGDFAEILLLSH